MNEFKEWKRNLHASYYKVDDISFDVLHSIEDRIILTVKIWFFRALTFWLKTLWDMIEWVKVA